MEHWFDHLAEPHTRRTSLKAAALAGAALVLPVGRLSSAWAAHPYPCTFSCIEEATAQWRQAGDTCDRATGVRLGGAYIATLAGALPGAVLAVVALGRGLSCLSTAELAYHRDVHLCFDPECSDPAKYPGGNPPAIVCKDPGYVPCGPSPQDCCNSANAECQQCPGKLVCCRKGSNCCPSKG